MPTTTATAVALVDWLIGREIDHGEKHSVLITRAAAARTLDGCLRRSSSSELLVAVLADGAGVDRAGAGSRRRAARGRLDPAERVVNVTARVELAEHEEGTNDDEYPVDIYDDVHHWHTEEGELHLFRVGGRGVHYGPTEWRRFEIHRAGTHTPAIVANPTQETPT